MKISWKCRACGHVNMTDVGGPGEGVISEVIEFKQVFNRKPTEEPRKDYVQECANCGAKNKVGGDG